MMRITVRRIREGLHPSEIVVAVRTAEGKDVKIVVDKDSVKNDTIDIGYPIARNNNEALVELPRETTDGLWRVWVAADSLREGAVA